jgi:hypothetical protein
MIDNTEETGAVPKLSVIQGGKGAEEDKGEAKDSKIVPIGPRLSHKLNHPSIGRRFKNSTGPAKIIELSER